MKKDLINYVKYCLGYIRLTKKRIATSGKAQSLNLSSQYLHLPAVLLNNPSDIGGSNNEELIKLSIFYKYSPDKVPISEKIVYEQEKELANKIEEICNIYRNDQYTKQITLEFGCFQAELPIDDEDIASEDYQEKIEKRPKAELHRIFSLPVKIEKKIEKDIGKYYITPLTSDVQVNLEMLEAILGADLYFEIMSKIGKFETAEEFELPITNLNTFQVIWDIIKAQLKLKNVIFKEESFDLTSINLALRPRSNYFLSEDLKALVGLPQDKLEATSLASWNQDALDVQSQIPKETQLYFPFDYDRSQLETLSLLKNRCSIIQGPPGTGKSTTIANILCHLAAQGNKILFVSQKAQALKVVKDKLKKLDVKYLYSYIANPNSMQLNEEDVADGVGPQLSALGNYINRLLTKTTLNNKGFANLQENKAAIIKTVENKITNRENLNKSIDAQRQYCKLDEQSKLLKEYDIELHDINKFADNANQETCNEIFALELAIIKLTNEIKSIENTGITNKELFENSLSKTSLNYEKYMLDAIQLNEHINNVFMSIIINIQSEIVIVHEKIKSLNMKISTPRYFKQKFKLDALFHNTIRSHMQYLPEIAQLKENLTKTIYSGRNIIAFYYYSFIRSRKLAIIFAKLPNQLKDYINDSLKCHNSLEDIDDFLLFIELYFHLADEHNQLLKHQSDIVSILSDNIQVFKHQLPSEILSWIETEICQLDITHDEIQQKLGIVINFLKYKEKIIKLSKLQTQLNVLLQKLGISHDAFNLISTCKNLKALSYQEVVDKIKELHQIIAEKTKLENCLHLQYSSQQHTDLEKERIKLISTYIQNNLNEQILLVNNSSINQIVRKLAGALVKSKRAFKTFDNLKKTPDYFKAALDIIPIWIMELDDASRIIPLEQNLFDYVILDEASQCNIAYALPAMYRTKKVIFVGDSEQMRDDTVAFKSNRAFDDLASRYQIPEEIRIKATGTSVQSVLDIGYKRGFSEKTLRSHYRSPVELIGFSNNYFYKPKGKELLAVNNNYSTYKDTNRVMVIHNITSDWQDEKDDYINVEEANFILNLFKDLRSENKYKNKSIGILSFFSKQAIYIRKLFETAGFQETEDNYKVCNIEGVQGDEKDIIIYSFVIRRPDQKKKYTPLTGESGDIKADINRGRVNVAFSRAKEQVHCVISLPLHQIPDDIWIKKYLEYVQDYGIVKRNTTKLQKFDSYFEETFYTVLHNHLNQDYQIQNQVASCGFKIDFVVSNIKTGKKIAIECDGPCHFQDEVDEALDYYIDNDEHRQKILESAGWKFYRIKYTDWIKKNFDQNSIIQDIIDLLK